MFNISPSGELSGSDALKSLPAGSVDLLIPSIIDGINVTSIIGQAFWECKSIKSVIIPNCVTDIGNCAFGGCISLQSIDVDPNNPNLKSIDGVLFTKDGKIIHTCPGDKAGSYTIPDGVTQINWDAFFHCEKLTSITIPNSVRRIGQMAFKGCKSLTSIIIPNTVTWMDDYIFEGCTSLVSANISNSLKPLGIRTFNECSALTSINIPSSITKISSDTFRGCTSLTSINIDKPIDSITGKPWGAPNATVKWLI